MARSSVESAAEVDYLLEIIKAAGPSVLPFLFVTAYSIAVNLRIRRKTREIELKEMHESTENRIKTIENQTNRMRESTENRIKTTENQIKEMRESTENRIKIIENQINEMRESTDKETQGIKLVKK